MDEIAMAQSAIHHLSDAARHAALDAVIHPRAAGEEDAGYFEPPEGPEVSRIFRKRRAAGLVAAKHGLVRGNLPR